MPATIRRVLDWPYSGVFIGVFCAGWLAMVGVAANFASKGVDIGFYFVLAYLFLAAAWVCSLGYWLTSDALKRKDPRRWKKSRKGKVHPMDVRRYRSWMWGGTLAILVVFLAFGTITRSIQHRMELSSPHGWLTPASDPSPAAGPCGPVPDNALLLIAGRWAVIAQTFPHALLRVNGKDVVVVHKREDGSVALTMDVLSADGKIIARIEKNEMTVNVNNVLTWKRPDFSTLLVENQNGDTVLKARYLNPRAIKFEAILQLPGVPSFYQRFDLQEGPIEKCFLANGSIEFRTD